MDVRKGSRRGGVGRHVGVENEYGDGDAATVRACPPTPHANKPTPTCKATADHPSFSPHLSPQLGPHTTTYINQIYGTNNYNQYPNSPPYSPPLFPPN